MHLPLVSHGAHHIFCFKNKNILIPIFPSSIPFSDFQNLPTLSTVSILLSDLLYVYLCTYTQFSVVCFTDYRISPAPYQEAESFHMGQNPDPITGASKGHLILLQLLIQIITKPADPEQDQA